MLPIRLYPFVLPVASSEERVIAIDPRIAFGRPVVLRNGVSTSTIAERIDAGKDIAADYEIGPATSNRLPFTNARRDEKSGVGLVYFTDRDLGKRFPEILRSGGLTVERHADHFAPGAPDEEWLETVGKRGWIALTHDRRIRYKPNERNAVMRHGVALLVIVGAAPFPELAHAFVATAQRVERFLLAHEPPFIAKVYRPAPAEFARGATAGRIELWYPEA